MSEAYRAMNAHDARLAIVVDEQARLTGSITTVTPAVSSRASEMTHPRLPLSRTSSMPGVTWFR